MKTVYNTRFGILQVLYFVFFITYAGKINSQQAVTGSGGNGIGTGGTVSYSVGQIVNSYITGTNGNINQGIQQPYEFFIASSVINKNINLVMMVYPNPVEVILNLKIDQAAYTNGLTCLLFDSKGSLIYNQKIESLTTEIPMYGLPAASYLLKVMNKNSEEMQLFKIIKN